MSTLPPHLELQRLLSRLTIDDFPEKRIPTNYQESIRKKFQSEMGESVRNHNDALCAKVNEYRLSDDYCDVELRVEEETFKCHRLILGAASEYFHIMFRGKFKESRDFEITLKETSADTFERVIHFIYTGEVSINATNLLDLLRASEFYKLPGLENVCIEYIREHPLVDNVSEIFSFCNTMGREAVAEILARKIFDVIDSFSRTTEFLKISFADLRRILNENRSYKPSNHDIFYKVILKWTIYAESHSVEERRVRSAELFDLVDFGKLSFDYFSHVTRIFIEECTKNTSSSISGDISRPKIGEGIQLRRLHAFIKTGSAFGEGFFSCSVFTRYKQMDNRFKWIHSYSMKNSSAPPYFMRTVELDDHLYCLSYTHPRKRNDFIKSSSVSLLPESNLSSPPFIIGKFDMCRMNHKIYIYNKYTVPHKFKNSQNSSLLLFHGKNLPGGVFFYNPEIDTWLSECPPIQKCSQACMTCDEQMLYLIGGSSSDKYVQGYDSRTPEWQALPTTSGIYSNAACCVSKGKIYVSGGFRNPMKVEVYDPVAGKWEHRPDMSEARTGHEMLVDESGACTTYNRFLSPGNNVDVLHIDGTGSSSLYEGLMSSMLLHKMGPTVSHMTLFKPYGWD